MEKKKKRRKSKGKKVSLPNNVAPIVVPHEHESKIIVEEGTLDDIVSCSYDTMSEGIIEDDVVMPITYCDNYDWEDNDTSYNLENL